MTSPSPSNSVRAFALAQRDSVQGFEMTMPSGLKGLGQKWVPLQRGGLLTSRPGATRISPRQVMSVATAKAAGVQDAWSPARHPTGRRAF